MTTLTIHDVTSTTISQGVHDAFTCQTLTIKTADGQTMHLKLFRSEPTAEGVVDVLQDAQESQDAQEAQETQEAQEAAETLTDERLLENIKYSLDDWGLSGYPEYSELVRQLYMEAKRSGSDVHFFAPTLREAFIWAGSFAGHRFYSKAYEWAVNNY